MMIESDSLSREKFLTGGSELGTLINSFNWTSTPLGQLENWPQSLKTSVNLILNSQHPMWIGWGPEATFLYNDAYVQVLSMAKHPSALGRPASEVWSEIWDVCGPLADKVFNDGIATYVEDVRLFMNRGNYFEETYYSFSYSPIYDESGKVAGLFCPSAETTSKVLHARRLKTLSELSSNALVEKTIRRACHSAFETLSKNRDDIPFAILYLLDSDRNVATREQYTGIPSESMHLLPDVMKLHHSDSGVIWPLWEAVQTKAPVFISLEAIDGFAPGCAGYKLQEAMVLPVVSAGHDAPVGALVVGINPCRKIDADYQTFYDLLSNQIATAIQNARAAEEERRRLEMLAEVDRAKTVFFNNVSHEFRTPLTLMLGPLEHVLNNSIHLLPAEDRQGLESTHRNAMRLFRLVNTLLDFSRIEAGKIQANFTGINLGAFTEDLASNFRSVVEGAQLKFTVKCEQLQDLAYVDPDMWEKIVFNLLSNAFKFTLEGEISVRLFQDGTNAVMQVEDTGIGIPQAEVPRLFERFHRIPYAAGRTFEGTGIGLSLVKELVTLHQGTIEVDSTEGKGTVFTIKLPLGATQTANAEFLKPTAPADGVKKPDLAGVYMKELESLMGGTLMWSGGDDSPLDSKAVMETATQNRILIVDDNADMRQYIRRMLSSVYLVEEAENGQAALEKVSTFQPQLIISDIMMPVMDGIQFLHALKNNPPTAHIPVILLSARAGEDARIEGYELGADDYLVKPFSVNELHARVKAQIRIARVRTNAEKHLRNVFQQAPMIIVVLKGPEFIVEITNEKLLEYWDKTQDEVLNRPLLEVLPEVADQGLVEILTQVLTTGVRQAENERAVPLMRHGRKEVTYISYVYEPLRDEEGNVTHVMVLANDVTEGVMARKRIEASERKFRNLVTQAPVGIAILRGRNFVVEVANESYLEIAKRSETELVGKPIFDVLPELGESPLPQYLNSVLDTGEPYFGSEFPIDFYRQGKMDTAYFNFVYQPLVEDDTVQGIIAVVVEVTDIVASRKMAQQLAGELEKRVEERTHELTLSNEKLAVSNRELEQFAYIASHDLQEPLRKIQMFSELLQKNIANTPLVEKYIGKIDSSALRMSRLIRDVLNYSRLSREGQPFEKVDLNTILENAKTDLELLIQETGAVIHQDELPVISGVPLQLHQLFSNLIGNSLKFSRESPVISIRCDEIPAEEVKRETLIDDSRTYIRLVFEDNGVGFEQQYADKIFVIFQRLNYDNKQAGTGIGLALCKKIVENHCGTIKAEGELNKGAKFTIYLPR